MTSTAVADVPELAGDGRHKAGHDVGGRECRRVDRLGG
jgi:hypothetical protein